MYQYINTNELMITIQLNKVNGCDNFQFLNSFGKMTKKYVFRYKTLFVSLQYCNIEFVLII